MTTNDNLLLEQSHSDQSMAEDDRELGVYGDRALGYLDTAAHREDWRGYARSVDHNGNRRYPDLFEDLLADPDPHYGDEAIIVGDKVEFQRGGETYVGTMTALANGFATVVNDHNYFSDVPLSGLSHA
jgi:hypothetical protein